MALGRSGSLTINTGQTPSLFGQPANTNQNSAAGSLFGSSAATAQQPAASSLFGNATNSSQTQPSRSLFGAPAAATTQQSGSMFSSTNPNAATNAGSSLFGNPVPAQQPQAGSSLFGGSNTQGAGTGGFGAQAQIGSVFGAAAANPPAGSSLFGAPAPLQQQQQNQSNPIFGLSASQPASLLSASQYRANQYAPFGGKLSMGQPGVAPAQQGAVNVNLDTMRSTTRFGDCIEEVQKQLEAVESMILAQERYCQEIEAFLPKHSTDVTSIGPDIELIREKVDAVEAALSMDAQAVAAQRTTVAGDVKDFQRCQRVVENLRMPSQFHVPSVSITGAANAKATHSDSDTALQDTDMIGSFFTPLAAEQQKALQAYAANLTEMEAHMRVIETSAVAQAQQLAARRAGLGTAGSAGSSADDNVRDLADTLRAFEKSILGAASSIGECRESVNELALGRLGPSKGGKQTRRW